MKDYKILKFLDKFQKFFNKTDVDYPVMRKILQVKLTMDNRRIPTVFNNNSSKKKNPKSEEKTSNALMYGINIFMSIFISVFVAMGENYIYQMSIVTGMLIFFIMMFMISDFSSVLLDTRDKNIIAPKPVTGKTLSIAKVIHILIYVSKITISLALLPMIVGTFFHGIGFLLIYLVEVILLNLFVVIITALFYLLIIKFSSGEKLKDIINYVQIFLAIFMSVGYQFLARMFDIVDFEAVLNIKWWHYFIPPIWFAAPYEVILKGNFDANYIALSILALVIPIVAIFVYIKLTPTFEANLQKLNDNSSKSKKEEGKLFEKVAKLVCPNREERSFFKFYYKLLKNEREFKLKVYPSMGMALAFPFIMMFSFMHGESFQSIRTGRLYLFIYMCVAMLPTAIMMIKFSGNYKGAWIYKTAPLKSPTTIFKGAMKASLVRLVLPIMIVEDIIMIAVFGIRIVPDLIVVFLVAIIMSLSIFSVTKKAIPFSLPFSAVQGQGDSALVFLMMLVVLALAGGHVAISFIPLGVYGYMIIALIATIILWKNVFKIPWNKIKE